jgi:arylsulfatase
MALSRRQFTLSLLATTALSTTVRAAPPVPRPNIITVVLDDVGFSDLGCFGAEIQTPNIDRIAAKGLRFNHFDTKAVCSSTRAALLTGRNSHTVNFPDVPDAAGGNAKYFPVGSFALPTNVQTTAQVFHDGGYATWLVGKWHLIPITQLGPKAVKDNWPLQRGFDYFYGYARGWTDQFKPELVENNDYIHPVLPSDYHLTVDLVDRSIALIDAHAREAASDKPFFLHLAFGAAHSPIQVPPEYSNRYAHVYSGWDEMRLQRFERMKRMGIIPSDCILPAREPDDRAWSDLSDDERIVFARFMEVYAGFVEHADAHLGRLIDHLERTGLADNTLLVLLSDNGAASEAGQEGFFDGLYKPNILTPKQALARLPELGTVATEAEYPRPWAAASCSPFRRYKLWPFLGGVRTPMILSWPGHIKDPGTIRTQYVDVIDVGPTLVEAAGLRFPDAVNGTKQIPVAGRSFLSAIGNPRSHTRKRQYFELRGNRAITDGPWRAVALHDCSSGYDQDKWMLFNTAIDFSESTDLAASRPQTLARLKALWTEEWDTYVGRPITQPAPNICEATTEHDAPVLIKPAR